MLWHGAAPFPPAPGRQEGQLSSTLGMTPQAQPPDPEPAERPGGYRGAQRYAALPPPPPKRVVGPRVPSLSRCGLRRRSVPPLLPAAAASLSFNYQLKPQHRAASHPPPPPPPPNPFQQREEEAGGLLSPGAGAPPGPARPPGPRATPAPAAVPHATPAAAVCVPRSLCLAGSAFGIPPPGSSPLGPQERLPSGAGRRGAEAGEWNRRRREPPSAARTNTLPGHHVTAGPAPLREGWAPSDPAWCPPLPGSHRHCLPASQNGVAAAGGRLRDARAGPGR